MAKANLNITSAPHDFYIYKNYHLFPSRLKGIKNLHQNSFLPGNFYDCVKRLKRLKESGLCIF